MSITSTQIENPPGMNLSPNLPRHEPPRATLLAGHSQPNLTTLLCGQPDVTLTPPSQLSPPDSTHATNKQAHRGFHHPTRSTYADFLTKR